MTLTQQHSLLRGTSSRAAARNAFLERPRPRNYERLDRNAIRSLLDGAIRAGAFIRPTQSNPQGREWAMLDTRLSEPGAYTIRAWTDARGRSRPIGNPSVQRYGGAVGLFTLESGFASVGPSPVGVDEGAGLLLFGFASMMAVPLPAAAASLFSANWLMVLSPFANNFDDAEVNRILLLSWAFLCEGETSAPTARSGSCAPARASSRRD